MSAEGSVRGEELLTAKKVGAANIVIFLYRITQ
jgi:hypothetical protein